MPEDPGFVLDDRDPERRRERQIVFDLATAYGGRDVYGQELARVIEEMLEGVGDLNAARRVLTGMLHAGVLVSFAGLSGVARALEVDFNEAVLRLEEAIDLLIEQADTP